MEEHGPVPDELRDRLAPRPAEQHAEVGDLGVGQLGGAAAISLDRHLAQAAHHVVGRMTPLLDCELVEVLVGLHVGLHAFGRGVGVAGLPEDDEVEPVLQRGPVLRGDPQDQRDHVDRELSGELGDDVERRPPHDGIEVLDDDAADVVFEREDGPRREHPADELAHAVVLGRIHADQAGPVHVVRVEEIPEPHAMEAAVGPEVPQRLEHVVVAREGVETEVLVPVQRSLVPQPPVGGGGVLEEVL